MSNERERLETPTDALITALEYADELDTVLVVGYTKAGQFFMCAHSSEAISKLGLLALASAQVCKMTTGAE